MTALTWSGVRNVRDVGGLPLLSEGRTAAGAVIRCGALDDLSPSGRRTLLATRPSRIIDLRSPGEIRAKSPMAEHDSYRHLPFIDPVRDSERVPESEHSRSDLYCGSLKRNGTHVARICREIADAPCGPVIVHCKSGVDRTGMLVALLLDVAGVVRDAIVADYLATAAAPGDAADQNTPRGVLGQPLTGRTMIDVLAWLDKRGGAAGYLMAHGVPKSHLRALRRRLTMGEMRPEL